MAYLDVSGLGRLWEAIKGYVDSRAVSGSIRQVQTVSATQSSGVAVGSFGNDITINLSSYGFKKTPIVVPQPNGWLEPRVKSVSTTTLVVAFFNGGSSSHSGGGKFVLIETL